MAVKVASPYKQWSRQQKNNSYIWHIQELLGGATMYTDYGYIGLADGIEYSTVDEAKEVNPNN